MKTALVCIAKREDYYIEEWLRYNFKLGFDDIWVYQNDWRYSGVVAQFPNLRLCEVDGPAKQLPVYNGFLQTYAKDYDWVAFFDVDEFLLVSNQTLKEWLAKRDNQLAVAVNWRIFGSSGLKFDGSYQVLQRFTKCEKSFNPHVKTIVHMSKAKPYWGKISFQEPHSLRISTTSDFTSNSLGSSPVHGPFNPNYSDPDVQLNHYFSKTFEEFQNKHARGLADQTRPSPAAAIERFRAHDSNDVEDTRALDFFLAS